MELTGIRKTVFLDRYARKGPDGKPVESSPEEMWDRVARAIAEVEEPDRREVWERRFRQALEGFKFVPGGRILAGAGTGNKVTYYNCYVIPSPEDSRKGIMDNVSLMVEIMSRGGGVGVNLSTLRPRGTYVKGVNGTASGPVSWAEVYSTATGSVIQGGSRRGALMLMLDDDHPDIEEFITVKRDLTKITNANLSVCISDAFMEAVQQDLPWDLKWNGKVYKTVRARDLWELICESAWASGEPGVVFMERVNKRSNTWYCETINCVNPCGEQPLGPWGVCNLGAINLAAFVQDGELDLEGLRETVGVAVRFLDNVIDATEYFFPENEKAQRYGIRRIGLGTMGLADMLIKLGVRYGSEKAFEVCDQVYRLIRDEAYRASALLAQEKGPFPLFDREKYLQGWFIQRLPEDIRQLIAQHGIRNGFLLTQAPTGTTSLLAGVSSGIEPVFAFSFKRTDRTGTHIVYHELYQKWLDEHPGEPVPDYFVSADQLTPEEHVRMQAVIQQYVDASISKTVNAPREHTVDQVRTLYRLAYELGCKGITYYRDGSREGVLHKLDDGEKGRQGKGAAQGAQGDAAAGAGAGPETGGAGEPQQPAAVAVTGAPGTTVGLQVTWGQIRPIERPSKLNGFTVRRTTPLGNLYLTLNTFNGYPFELFAQIGKAGSDVAAFTEAIARLVSLAFRAGIDPHEVVEQLRGIGGSRSVGFGPNRVLSVPDAIAQFLDDYLAGKIERDPVDEVAAGQLTVFPGDPAQEAREVVAAARAGQGAAAADEPAGGTGAGPAGDAGTGLQGAGGAAGNGAARTDGVTAGGQALAAGGTAGHGRQGAAPITGGNGRELSMNLCPECGSHALVHEEGCSKCLACGYSEC
ncbi:adenosylcobalamin-dependent ribonucleoside-diphosphate reductase [Thermaerobacter sp. PB12/4term]|uniref:adenosylcobalamin-dependent ribonucleoside-diphosphate reductase n=1 Tax=Thermaerobacter sp. PB12/4term TaxID=2293838 RepID=UPI000E3274EB|nr:adenosylcobalamin-dependent ribonucleoside-diphosphate reductase [Thermaerobacter sp. PB12/4term]QIA26374.1 adenosylcobalamin-dependent ribonucleoside-diphosphate reductase [Thermaerobacter sp. PB12/4term]